MNEFAAIDFETANQYRTSVCSVGIVVVREGEIIDKFYSLIRPEPEFYAYWCTKVHGLTKAEGYLQLLPLLPESLSLLHHLCVRQPLV